MKKSLEKENLNGYIVANEKNILYFSNFLGGVRLLIPRESENILYVRGVNYESAKRTAKNCRVKLIKMMEDADLSVRDQVKRLNLSRIGFDVINASLYLKLTNVLKGVKLEDQSTLVQELRDVKDEKELRYLRKAAEITSEGMKTAFEVIRPGLLEYEVAAEIEYAMRKLGSNGVAFDSIVASSVRSAFPHGGCTDQKIRRDDLVMIDIGAKYQNYVSDLTRTVVVGKLSPKQQKIYEITNEAQQRAFQAIQEGVKACEVDAVARDFIKKEGYEKNFVHNLGHGVGLDVHETPILSSENKNALKSRNVVTVEPGIYITGFGGIRIEDTVLVHKDGAERLTKAVYTPEVK